MTYGVIDVAEALERASERIRSRLKGFNLAIDFSKLSYTDKLLAREQLLDAIAKLDPGQED
jgi:hypothetical protein